MRNLPASISRPTTPPQAFQPPPPVPPLSTLPPAEAEELRQLRLQFQQQQQQQAAHHLQQQALFHSSFNPFFSPFQLYFPPPSLPLTTASPPNPPSGPPPVPPSAPEPAPVAPEPADLSISLFTSQPPRRHRPIDLPIVRCDQRPPHDCLSNGLGADLTSPHWSIQLSWSTSWTISWRSLLIWVLRNTFGPHLFGFTFAQPALLTFGTRYMNTNFTSGAPFS